MMHAYSQHFRSHFHFRAPASPHQSIMPGHVSHSYNVFLTTKMSVYIEVAYPCAMFGSPNPFSPIYEISRTLAVDLKMKGTSRQRTTRRWGKQGASSQGLKTTLCLEETYPSSSFTHSALNSPFLFCSFS